jgi:hypothetical protein
MKKYSIFITILLVIIAVQLFWMVNSYEALQMECRRAILLVTYRELSEIDKENNPLSRYFPKEYRVIRDAAYRNKCVGEDFVILFAIRKAENGRQGLEFGIMNPKADNLDKQAGWAAATIVKTRERWRKAGCPGDFIEFLGRRYCPVGAENDPDGLNKHWIKNVKHWVRRLKYE